MMNLEQAVPIPPVTIIIPAYNEESRIKGVLDEISNFISRISRRATDSFT